MKCQTATDILSLLKKYNFKRNSNSIQDYERAKHILPNRLTADEYENAIKFIAEYLQV